MRSYRYETVDVFTRERFGGNPLAVVLDADGLSDGEMQAIAAEFNYSETSFVLRPDDPAHDARVRIFNRTTEMPFAGHPNVGTAWVLAGLGRDRGGVLLFEEIAGLVRVEVQRDAAGAPTGAVIDAPQPLSLGLELPVDGVAACIGAAAADIATAAHRPVVASVGVTFVLAEVSEAALTRARPDAEAFRRIAGAHPALAGRLSLFVYTRAGEGRVRARMFAPLAGTHEDPATGSANCALAALLLSLDGGERLSLEATQGVELGRPSTLSLTAERTRDGVRARVGGGVVPVFRGELVL
jgi:trans-2,3-dihydro-3-hydroxyanthranilate isomerase